MKSYIIVMLRIYILNFWKLEFCFLLIIIFIYFFFWKRIFNSLILNFKYDIKKEI